MFSRRRAPHRPGLGPVTFQTDSSGEIGNWSQVIVRVPRSQSPSWNLRNNRAFRPEDVYPSNEGYPQVTYIGPTNGGIPILFDLILSDGTRCQGIVGSILKIEEQPAWVVVLPDGKKKGISYYHVAAWRSLQRKR